MADDMPVFVCQLNLALDASDWQRAKDILEKFKDDEDVVQFAYGNRPVPAGCYSILIARLQGEPPSSNPSFAEVRERLNQKVQKQSSSESATFLSMLAVVDALLGKKQIAVSEAKRAVEISAACKNAMDDSNVVLNLAVVYAWTDEFDLAFETLARLTKIAGIHYGQLKLDPYWDPIRKDPRFVKLLAESAPRELGE